MEIVGLFAMTALILAGLGVYGLMSYNVTERTREIGIRLALGADRRTIIRLVLRDGLRLALAGAALGLCGAVFVSRAMADLLFGVHPHDVVTFVGVTIALGAVTLCACYIPARRAVQLDPSRIL
jgi:ABC-type antimicrobial peptide transport system permease subunit